MTNITEYFIKGSDNKITLTLREGGDPIADSPTQIVIDIDGVLTITRSPTGNGVEYSSGVLEIAPGELTEDLSPLNNGRVYRVRIVIRTAVEPNGVVFGGNDSDNLLYFSISTAP